MITAKSRTLKTCLDNLKMLTRSPLLMLEISEDAFGATLDRETDDVMRSLINCECNESEKIMLLSIAEAKTMRAQLKKREENIAKIQGQLVIEKRQKKIQVTEGGWEKSISQSMCI